MFLSFVRVDLDSSRFLESFQVLESFIGSRCSLLKQSNPPVSKFRNSTWWLVTYAVSPFSYLCMCISTLPNQWKAKQPILATASLLSSLCPTLPQPQASQSHTQQGLNFTLDGWTESSTFGAGPVNSWTKLTQLIEVFPWPICLKNICHRKYTRIQSLLALI